VEIVRPQGDAMIRSTLASLALGLAGAAQAAEIRVGPSDYLIAYPTNENKGYVDVMVQTVVVSAAAGERFRLESVELDLTKGGRLLSSRLISADRMLSQTKGLATQPQQGYTNAQLLNRDGLSGLLGAPASFAQSTELGGGQALVLAQSYLSIDDQPDSLRVIALGKHADGSPLRLETSIPVRPYRSPIAYRFPLKDAWLMASFPMLQSHHRFIAPNEFASDFFKVDADGETYKGDAADAANWYAWGQEVSAAADGVVVDVDNDEAQDRAFLARVPGETPEARGARVGQIMEARVNAHFPGSSVGNHVTIRHEKDGVVEYSTYAHLKTGSVRVKVGDRVVQGQVIAQVGDTGDTPVVHLHFQINAGPDILASRSLPFRFVDVTRTGATRDPGYFLRPR
jgi:murein DD-endopeptidase MepM/ murein hydrolase activator NlpD